VLRYITTAAVTGRLSFVNGKSTLATGTT